MTNSKAFLLLTTSLLFQGIVANVNLETLQLVQVVFRHGERVPEYPYPTDPYNAENYWKEGWAQLTDVGKRQEFDLGVYLRQRYQTFISDNYVVKEIQVVSSDTDRTIMSAQLCLAGMFPTVNGTNWNPELKWQPYPIRTIAKEHDNILRDKKECPLLDTETQNVLRNTPEAVKINNENKELFEYLSNHSGVHIQDINAIDSFYATMFVEELLGLPLPDWAVPVVNTENFQYLYNLSFAAKTSTLELKRLRVGPFFNIIRSNFHERIANSSMKTKMFMYSGHDTTLVNILNAFEVLDLQRPSYASIIIMELHKNDANNYFVNLIFRNDTTREPYNFVLPGCSFDCPFDNFSSFVEPMIVSNWEEECLLEPGSSNRMNPILRYFLAALVGVLILLFTYFLVSKVCCKKRQSSLGSYESL